MGGCMNEYIDYFVVLIYKNRKAESLNIALGVHMNKLSVVPLKWKFEYS